MSVDLRRFTYALAPLLQRRQWEMDALRTRLGRLQNAIDAAVEALRALHAEHRQQSELMTRALQLRLDPRQHAANLHWLRQLSGRIERSVGDLTELQTQRVALAAQCVAHQQQLDMIQSHRSDALVIFAREEGGRMATEADKDWLMRQAIVANLHRTATQS